MAFQTVFPQSGPVAEPRVSLTEKGLTISRKALAEIESAGCNFLHVEFDAEKPALRVSASDNPQHYAWPLGKKGDWTCVGMPAKLLASGFRPGVYSPRFVAAPGIGLCIVIEPSEWASEVTRGPRKAGAR